jgi:mannose-1-phosphate guanylyltransferase
MKEESTNIENQQKYLEIGDRPWGQYFVLVDEANYKVKKIIVQPSQRLSLQSHKHRSEHWIVVSGVATVQIAEEIFDLLPNQSCYIKSGSKHRLSNAGKIPLIIIEVQCGEYTGEDDIERFEDDYSR